MLLCKNAFSIVFRLIEKFWEDSFSIEKKRFQFLEMKFLTVILDSSIIS